MEPDSESMAPAMALALQANFGSVAQWRAGFAALAQAALARSQAVALVFQPGDGTLANQAGAAEADAVPLLTLAPAALAAAGLEAALDRIDWGPVYERYQAAVAQASEPWGVEAETLAGAMLLDVRRAGVYRQAATRIPGARWRDPAAVAVWAQALPRDRRVVVHCVYGHEVGRATALRLRAAGLDAWFLRGGIEGWKDAGRPLAGKEDWSER